MNTLGLQEAAAMLRMSPDALMRKARAGIVPGDKPGREWVFVEDDLLAWLRERTKARACHSTAILRAPTGGSALQSAESKLGARLRQLNAQQPKNSKPVFALISGGKSASGSGRGTPGRKPSSDGTKAQTDATAHAKGSA